MGSNVRPISDFSVSIPLFPCVNALPSKNTASLFIYCVRRWVLSLFLSPFHGYRKSCLLLSLFKDQMSGIGSGQSETESERTGEQNESTCGKDWLCKHFSKSQMPARDGRTCGFCASVRGRNEYECVPNCIKDIFCIS